MDDDGSSWLFVSKEVLEVVVEEVSFLTVVVVVN
jgi:hypothetical protein